jgi:thiosulfate/3-mercaptopyruvate sulfurtransferase
LAPALPSGERSLAEIHADLTAHFADLRGSDTAAIMYCGSGVNACHNILAMEVAGLGRPDLYVGSWSDWSSSDRPIAIGSEPG